MSAATRVALFGGTFDPIHNGHMAAARACLASGLVDRVCFIPAGAPPHKPGGPVASAEARWCMTVLATLAEPGWRVERWEIDRAGPSFAIDTVRHAGAALRAADGTPPELYWLIGTDAMALIDTWRDVETLFALTRFLVIPRDGMDEAALRARLADTLPFAAPDRVRFLAMPPLDVSSTALRDRLARGELPRGALPESVATFVSRYAPYTPPRTFDEAPRP